MATEGTERLENIPKITQLQNWECGGTRLQMLPPCSGHALSILLHCLSGPMAKGQRLQVHTQDMEHSCSIQSLKKILLP